MGVVALLDREDGSEDSSEGSDAIDREDANEVPLPSSGTPLGRGAGGGRAGELGVR